jgi:predicted acetyltransferase
MILAHRGTWGTLPTSSFDLLGDDNSVIGRAQIRHQPTRNLDLPPEAANHIYYEIEPRHRGRGHGKALMGLVLDEARRIGLERVRLTCTDDNPASRHIIESHGAVLLGDFISRRGERYHLFEISV